MPANLKLLIPNFTRLKGYFYHLDQASDVLYKKVDSGENAFSYPLDTDIANPVQCLQTDGTFFYTLENLNSGNGQLLIKKWKIEEFTLKLKRVYTLVGAANQKYNCNSFSIESFERTFAATAVAGSNIITLSSNARVAIGDALQLGGSTFSGDEGKTETVTVLSVLPANQVQLTTNLQHSYLSGNRVGFAKRCWLFNQFKPNDPDSVNGSGQLYSFELEPLVTSVVARKSGNEFRSVLASMFIQDLDYPSGSREFLAYMNQSNLLFIETDTTSPNFLETIQSAAQNNQEVGSAIIPVYDIAYESRTIFRLQRKATYRNGSTYTTEDWGSQYNYQVSTLQRLPQSISLSASPPIISADSVSVSTITAIVKDQFDVEMNSRRVYFTDDDSVGFMNPTQADTVNGTCTSTYRAGTTARTVTITSET